MTQMSSDTSESNEEERGGLGAHTGSRRGSAAAQLLADAAAGSEDDYMAMTFDETPSVLLPAAERRELEKHDRGRQRQATEAATEHERREKGLKRNLMAGEGGDEAAGLKMMRRMGYVPGQALGREGRGEAVTEPLQVQVPTGRAGIGHASAQRAALDASARRLQQVQQEQQQDFRSRVQQAHAQSRAQSQLRRAQRICEQLYEEQRERAGADTAPLHDLPRMQALPVVWRGLVRDRLLAELHRRQMQQIMDATGQEESSVARVEQMGELEPDEELDHFESYDSFVQLHLVLEHLREIAFYCMWCGCAYDDAADLAENCPGLFEEDH